jgi:catechol 2,3-dioxygenase-like lactoylglutathione lyase family enzyme
MDGPVEFALRKIGHVVLDVSDLEASVRFYTEVLGLRVSDRYPDAMVPGGVVFLRCNTDHLLGPRPDRHRRPRPSGGRVASGQDARGRRRQPRRRPAPAAAPRRPLTRNEGAMGYEHLVTTRSPRCSTAT